MKAIAIESGREPLRSERRSGSQANNMREYLLHCTAQGTNVELAVEFVVGLVWHKVATGLQIVTFIVVNIWTM